MEGELGGLAELFEAQGLGDGDEPLVGGGGAVAAAVEADDEQGWIVAGAGAGPGGGADGDGVVLVDAGLGLPGEGAVGLWGAAESFGFGADAFGEPFGLVAEEVSGGVGGGGSAEEGEEDGGPDDGGGGHGQDFTSAAYGAAVAQRGRRAGVLAGRR